MFILPKAVCRFNEIQYFGHLMWRANSLEKTLMLGKVEGRRKRGNRGWDGWKTSLTQWTWLWESSRRWWRTGKPDMLQPMGSQRVGHNWATQYQSQFSHSLMSDSLWSQGLKHTRPLCPSPTPGVHPNLCPLSWWCHQTISSSFVPFSSCPQSFPASASFQMSQLFSLGG